MMTPNPAVLPGNPSLIEHLPERSLLFVELFSFPLRLGILITSWLEFLPLPERIPIGGLSLAIPLWVKRSGFAKSDRTSRKGFLER